MTRNQARKVAAAKAQNLVSIYAGAKLDDVAPVSSLEFRKELMMVMTVNADGILERNATRESMFISMMVQDLT